MRQHRKCSDEELVSRVIADDDQAAFAFLVERHEAMVMCVCMRVLHHQHDAEAARQEAFIVLWQKADSIQDRRKLNSWLYGVAQREALRIRKKRHRREKHEIRCDCNEQFTQFTQFTRPDDEVALRETQIRVREELQHLPSKYRKPLQVCYLEGKSKAEAATFLELPEGTVSCRLTRGREMLRRRLTHYGFASAGE